MDNWMELTFPSLSINEGFARSATAAFAALLDPTIDELSDLRTAVSEAVTNAIVHGYSGGCGMVEMKCRALGRTIEITITDYGCGIDDVALAMQPLYSGSDDEERSGMGFTVMQSFMDSLSVESEPGVGTTVTMTKRTGEESDADE